MSGSASLQKLRTPSSAGEDVAEVLPIPVTEPRCLERCRFLGVECVTIGPSARNRARAPRRIRCAYVELPAAFHLAKTETLVLNRSKSS
jgi:hypothetical protein